MEEMMMRKSYVFSNCTGLDDIRLPETLRHIGAYAFECCEIERCYLPDGISDIDPKAFEDMNCTPTLLFSASNQYALNYAKQYGIRYKIRKNGDGGTFGKGLSWELKNGVLTITGNGSIPDYKWNRSGRSLGRPWEKYKGQITDVMIGDGITRIGNNAFAYLEAGSVNLTIQGNVLRSIGKGGFDGTRLKAIDLPDSVEVLGESALSGTAVKKIALPAGLKRIGEYCFSSTRELVTVTFKGTGLTEIPESAFDNSKIEVISLPAGIVSIGPASGFRQGSNTSAIQPSKTAAS